MKVIIAGSRIILDIGLVTRAIEKSGFTITEVVCGGARGVDALGKKWAEENGIPVKMFQASWDNEHRRAGILRNEQMGKYADVLIAVWDGKSNGTQHMISFMEQNNKQVYVEMVK